MRACVQFCHRVSPFVHSTVSCIIYLQYLSHIVWYSNSILISSYARCLYLFVLCKVCAFSFGVCVYFFYLLLSNSFIRALHSIYIFSSNFYFHVEAKRKKNVERKGKNPSMLKDTKGNNTVSNLAEWMTAERERERGGEEEGKKLKMIKLRTNEEEE